jgi:elongation factor Ts
MAVTAAEVKTLRERTGVGPADCKKALVECNGDMAAAEKMLKERGLAAAEKRSERATNQGRITIKHNQDTVVLVEVAAETDFVARNPEFVALGEAVAAKALENNCAEVTDELQAMVKDLATKIRENMTLRRVRLVKANPNQYIDTYLHGGGAIGVAVIVSSDKPEVFKNDEVKTFVHDLSLHVTNFNPLALSTAAVPAALKAEQEEIFSKQMEGDENLAAKPPKVRAGILQGKMKKWLSDICLLDQAFIRDDKLTVAKALEAAGKQAGATLTIDDYIYMKVGA